MRCRLCKKRPLTVLSRIFLFCFGLIHWANGFFFNSCVFQKLWNEWNESQTCVFFLEKRICNKNVSCDCYCYTRGPALLVLRTSALEVEWNLRPTHFCATEIFSNQNAWYIKWKAQFKRYSVCSEDVGPENEIKELESLGACCACAPGSTHQQILILKSALLY